MTGDDEPRRLSDGRAAKRGFGAAAEFPGREAGLDDAYNTPRHLLYVACTHARDYLPMTAAKGA